MTLPEFIGLLIVMVMVFVVAVLANIGNEIKRRQRHGEEWSAILRALIDDPGSFMSGRRPADGDASPSVFRPPVRVANRKPGPVYLPVNLALQKLRELDPEFSEAAFLTMARQAFLAIQAAWSQQDLESARRFLSRGVFQRFADQLAALQQRRHINRLENVTVNTANIVLVEPDRRGYQAITARLGFSMIDMTVHRDTGQVISGSRHPEPGTEFWSFGRRRGTTPGHRVAEGQCPQCGASIAINAHGRCEYCDCDIQSGEYDWVLIEITQTSAWTQPRFSNQAAWLPRGVIDPGRGPAGVAVPVLPGLTGTLAPPAPGGRRSAPDRSSAGGALAGEEPDGGLLATDPAFSRADLEDYASALFIRICRAIEEGRPELVGGRLSSELYASLADQVQRARQARLNERFDHLAVGSCELESHRRVGEHDWLTVKVAASAARHHSPIGAGPAIVASEAAIEPFTAVLVLRRKAGTTTVRGKGLFADSCPGCGHPLRVDDRGLCESCGLEVGRGDRDWVVVEASALIRQGSLPDPV